MSVIYKYPLEMTDQQVIEMPAGAKPLSVQAQHDRLCLWALVAPENPPSRFGMRVAGTGHPIADYWTPDQYVGTVQMLDGDLVWHVFVWESGAVLR